MLDLIIKNANLVDGRTGVDIAIEDERIAAIGIGIAAEARDRIDATGNLVSPPFVDSHFHLDAALSLGRPRFNETGTLLEGIALWSEAKALITAEDIEARALALCRWSIANGTLALRSHVDVCDDSLLAVEALLGVRDKMKPYLDLQFVAFPQDGYLRSPSARDNLRRALDLGVDVVGGIPHFKRTTADGTSSIAELCRIAADRGLRVDMHCDESDDPQSRHIETLTAETKRLGLEGRVAGSHLTSMHSMDNYYVSKLIPLMAEARIHAIANPLINITLQGRHDTYPKRRGMTRVKELLAAGVNTAFGHDCVMDPWYSLGRHDMLEVAFMGLHVGQMTGRKEMRAIYDAITVNGAAALGLEDYGLAEGKPADLVVLQASDPIEALRLQATRLFVIRRGKIIASATPAISKLVLGSATSTVDFRAATY
jgi:cytosine/creatinine deaminase